MRVIYMGSELRFVFGSAAALAEREHDVFYINLTKNSFQNYIEKIRVEVREGYPIEITQINIPYTEQKNAIVRKIKPAKISRLALKLLKEISPDVTVSRRECWPIAYAISQKLDVPLIFSPTNIRGLLLFSHVLLTQKYSEILQAPLSFTYNIALSHLSNFTIVPNKRVERIFRNLGVRRVATLHPPYARVYLSPKQIKVDLHKRYILTIATLSRFGNVEIDLAFLKIVLAIARCVPHILFVVVGTSLEDLKKFGKALKVPKNVEFAGKIYDDNSLGLLYKKAGCVLCPLLLPAPSNRLLEAFFYSRPIITTEIITKYYDGLTKGKHCIVEEDFTKWPSIICEILDNENLTRDLEAGAQNYYNEIFSPRKHSLLLEQVLASLLIKSCSAHDV